MKLQLRLLFVMVGVILVIGGLLVLQRDFDLQRSQRILQSELSQHKQFFAATMTTQQQPLKTLSEDYSFWDEMVDFVKDHNMKFAHDNIDTGLETFDIDAAWVYDAVGKPVYSSQLDSEKPISNPHLPADFFETLKRDKTIYFYVRDGADIIEVRGATIVPGNDPQHTQAARGFWLVAQRIDADYLSSLAELSQSKPTMVPATADLGDVVDGATVSFGTALPGVDKKPVAVIRDSFEVTVVSDLNKLYSKRVVLLSAVGLLLVTVVSVVIWLWVLKPIKTITASIRQQQPESLEELSKTKTEFGGLAQTVQEFFKQKVAIAEAEIRQADLERLNKDKSTFLSMAAHELKGPINIVRLLSEDLPKRLNTPGPAGQQSTIKTSLETLEHQSSKMATIINDLHIMSLGKGTDDIEFRPEPIDFDHFLQGEIEANQFITDQKITLSGSTNATCNIDPARLSQVVSNLIRNASKYGSDAKTIDISTRLDGGTIVLEVKDHGIGISEADQQHIFELYYRAETVTHTYQGLGLGLAICKRIVEHCGGTISVTSTVGQGSTFVVRLPIES